MEDAHPNQITLEDRIVIRLYGYESGQARDYFIEQLENTGTRLNAVHKLALWLSAKLGEKIRFKKGGEISVVGSNQKIYVCPPHWLAPHL